MSDDRINQKKTEELLKEVPEQVARFRRENKPTPLDEIFPGDKFRDVRTQLKATGMANMPDSNGKNVKIGAHVDDSGNVIAMAAKVSRTPSKSYDYVENINDFDITSSTNRADKIPVYYQIYKNEGMINNAINKTAAFVSAEGNFKVKRARRGNRKIENVEEELLVILDFWQRNVNATGLEGPVTGARGLSSIIDQGSRQALIEGSWIGYTHNQSIEVPSLGKSYNLPMFVQTLSSRYVEIPEGLVGTGLELFYWRPPATVINAITNSSDPDIKELVEESFDRDFLSELQENRRAKLDRSRIMHVKHRSVDTEPFGESFIEPVITDIAYKRALQQLDFVIIEAMINRILIVKVGDPNPDSDYHNLEFAQIRLNLLKSVFDTTDPSMTILWAGHDIEVVDVGVHQSLADLDGRYNIAHERMKYSIGVPNTLLIGEGGSGQIWAAYEGYRETLRAMQNYWGTAMIDLGEKIAAENGFEGVELEFTFNRNVLADQQANADLMLRKYKTGVSSIRETIEGTGGDYESVRRQKIIERGLDPSDENLPSDEELFTPPLGFPGDTRVDPDGNLTDPGGEPGRPPESERENLDTPNEGEDRNNSIDES